MSSHVLYNIVCRLDNPEGEHTHTICNQYFLVKSFHFDPSFEDMCFQVKILKYT